MEGVKRLCSHKYLSETKTRGFDNYKYSSVDTSPIAVYVSHPFWNQVVKLYPLWIAPNALTLGGFLLVMGCYFLVSYYDYYMNRADHEQPVPDWVWMACAVCTFVAHVLDGTDGKQARRTNTSGPMGELFDHGLDSWSTLPFTVTLFTAFGRGPFSVSALRLLCVLISVQLVFIVTHWEKYNTGILFLSWGYDVSQYGLALFYLVTYFVGYKFWQFYVIGQTITFAHVFEAGFYVMCLASVAMSLYNMHHSYCVERTGLQPNLIEGVRPMFPFVVLSVVSVLWACMSPIRVIDIDPRVYIWMNGTIFSNVACRLIVAQMTKTKAETWNLLLYPLCLGAILSQLHLGGAELWLMRAIAVGVTLAHVHYGVCVVNQLCDHFGIRPLTITDRTNSDKNNGSGGAGGQKSVKYDYTKAIESVNLLSSTSSDDERDPTSLTSTSASQPPTNNNPHFSSLHQQSPDQSHLVNDTTAIAVLSTNTRSSNDRFTRSSNRTDLNANADPEI